MLHDRHFENVTPNPALLYYVLKEFRTIRVELFLIKNKTWQSYPLRGKVRKVYGTPLAFSFKL